MCFDVLQINPEGMIGINNESLKSIFWTRSGVNGPRKVLDEYCLELATHPAGKEYVLFTSSKSLSDDFHMVFNNTADTAKKSKPKIKALEQWIDWKNNLGLL